ncbi:MAG: hypothetical protein AAFQ94_31120 [Bacteroidota bacterium]
MNKDILQEIWSDDSFQKGYKYFWYGNNSFFRFVDKSEFLEVNSDNNAYLDYNKGKFGTLRIVAIADFNGDNEHEAYILADTVNNSVHLFSFWGSNNEPKQIAESLNQMFENSSINECLIKQKDSAFWSWNEGSYHSYTIDEIIPKGVVPRIDLRIFVKSFRGSYVSDYKEFNLKSFVSYFDNYGLGNHIPEDFYTFTIDEKLETLISRINSENKTVNFRIISFNPSGYWGIINTLDIENSDMVKLEKYGLISK